MCERGGAPSAVVVSMVGKRRDAETTIYFLVRVEGCIPELREIWEVGGIDVVLTAEVGGLIDVGVLG